MNKKRLICISLMVCLILVSNFLTRNINNHNEVYKTNHSPPESKVSGEIPASLSDSPEGLIGWWQGEGNADDELGETHGTFVGTEAYGNGIKGQAFQLDGVDSFIDIPNSPEFDFGINDFAISFWVSFSSIDCLSREMVLIEKYVEKMGASSLGWTFTKLSHNELRFAVPANDFDMNPPPIELNNWINIAISRKNGFLSFYWNTKVLLSAYLEDIKPSNSSLKLGHRGNSTDTPGSVDNSGYYLHGLIDEIKIYNRSLTRKEIETEFKEILKPHAAITISSDAELAATADSGTGSVDNPFVIEEWIINTTDEQPIFIHNTSTHFVIRNCWFETGNTRTAIFIQNARKGTITLDSNYCTKSSGIVINNISAVIITDNVCLENDEGEGYPCGVHLIDSGFSNITNNYFSFNDDCGIWLTNSPNCIIQNNICDQNRRGIEVQTSANSTIINNTFNNNEIGGIWMYGESSNSVIESNLCKNNSYGIQLENSHQCAIQWNTLIGNEQYGVWLINSNDNIIYYNSCTNNNKGSSQIQDQGSNNQWFENSYSASEESSSYYVIDSTTTEGNIGLSNRVDNQIMKIISSFNLAGILILLVIITTLLLSYKHQR